MAITFDNATDGLLVNPGTNLAYNHTIGAGSNGIILSCYNGDNIGGNDDVTSDTYNSVALSLYKKLTAATSGDRISYIDALLNPTSGTHQVSISTTNSHVIQGGAVSYFGVKQSGQPDASTTNFSSPGATTLTTTINVVTANSWVILLENCYDSGNPPTAGAGATRRTFDSSNGGWGIFDSGGPVSAGNYNITTNRGGNPFGLAIIHVVVAIAPDTGVAIPQILIDYPDLLDEKHTVVSY